jgi:hypothetical protein
MPRAVPLACMHAAIMEAPHMDIHSANRQLLTSKCDKIQQKTVSVNSFLYPHRKQMNAY